MISDPKYTQRYTSHTDIEMHPKRHVRIFKFTSAFKCHAM